MGGGKKNKNKGSKNSVTQTTNKFVEIKSNLKIQEDLTVENVKNSISEEEFNKKKDELFGKFDTDIQIKQEKLNSLDKEISEEDSKLVEIKQTLSDLNQKKEEAEAAYYTALREEMSIMKKANDEARKAWAEHAKAIEKNIKEVGERERQLFDEKQRFESEKALFELQKEEVESIRAFVESQKEAYKEMSPGKVEELKADLQVEHEKYEIIKTKFENQSKKYAELQNFIEDIKAEIDDKSEKNKKISLKEIVEELDAVKDENFNLRSICASYPDINTIKELENKANKIDDLIKDYEVLTRERDSFREQLSAAFNTQKEYETIKKEVDATRALNDHLLQELASHKRALESRTGDTCPSLSTVDDEVDSMDYSDKIEEKKGRKELMSLKEIVSHVKNYAGSREDPLYYKDNDIIAFLSGLAVSKLLVLQGMSGTGKSSLPQIFSQAISGADVLVPVESSWRDRNELLGYYNDFNKKFNAKTFTIELYRSSKEKCRDIPTFIILDEMNLARIEYYFSDFLSILQKEKEDWLIELVSTDMRTLPMELSDNVKKKMQKDNPSIFAIWQKIEKSREGDLKSQISDEEESSVKSYLAELGKLTGAKDLIDGRKIKVNENVWFVGTANKDESTFEISDKVYDRAQIIALNEKGKSEGNYRPRPQQFISVGRLYELFNQAIKENPVRTEVENRLSGIDELMIKHFKTSFGNRIEKQTVDFVGVFVASGGSVDDAIDYQLSTKIIRKVLTSDKAAELITLRDELKAYKQTYKLLDERIDELTE